LLVIESFRTRGVHEVRGTQGKDQSQDWAQNT